ncbi:phosphopantetheine-binding protein (plasmid) [Streptomyces sp. NBC_01717]|uniref:phosphopantetheine-binding protein n=1 Tax=Streptomyces sp. NBC_01717 TaxID=2975918 RepID=UPI002E2F758C|nr:phosphopantetheine-binding protein [Streptomyces sp. NBC_01717]
MDTSQRVWKVLTHWCDLPSEPIQPDLQLDSLDLDSLSMLEISLGLDKEFNTTIPESEIKQAKTVADLADLAETHRTPK